ncbi:spore germination protein [Ectobacillus sp. JY-23]|uniref:spore germination protein n=1 Tax=Ectobacillus sp. JY-23 TaxID=2933872 RepID=UPI001FF397FB|nr:spore germination protein [Ectobacillus sp. JY-23]UOY91855.1 spore germination protein [Ectobacillus sp. JY-23]
MKNHHVMQQEEHKDEIFISLVQNTARIQQDFGDSTDLSIRHITLGKKHLSSATLVRIEGLSDEKLVSKSVIQPLIELWDTNERMTTDGIASCLQNNLVTTSGLNLTSRWKEVFRAILEGDTAVFIDGCHIAIIASTRGGERRSITEPSTQTTIRGPKEGFVESIRTNTALVRRKIKNPKLRVEAMEIGTLSQTSVEIMYVEGIVDEEVLMKVQNKLQTSNLDMVLESGDIERLIENNTHTVFPTVYHTERPDVVASDISQGRVAVFVDGTPFVLIAPVSFFQFFQSPEDYYERKQIGYFIRGLRFVSFLVALLAPSIYISLITHHQSMLPTHLLISLYAQREGIPFPAIIEAFLMELLFELLREAGIRMPRIIGPTVSIVGAIVLGQAAVQAGIVSTAMIIVVSITAISSFTLPSYNLAATARILRFVLMIAAFLLGFYGILLGFLVLLAHTCSLYSFGELFVSTKLPGVQGAQRSSQKSFWARVFDIKTNSTPKQTVRSPQKGES